MFALKSARDFLRRPASLQLRVHGITQGRGLVDRTMAVGSENSSRLEFVDLHGSWISLGLR